MIKRGDKKSQITIFIVLGIIILLSYALFLLLKSNTTFFRPENVPPKDIDPIVKFTQSCIETSAKEAEFILRMQGGYIDPFASFPAMQYEKDSFLDNGFIVPYWYYDKDNRMPTFELLEKQIADYVAINVVECINSYEDFKNEYDITELGAQKVTAVINDKDVTVTITYPLEITNKIKNKMARWDTFTVNVDSRLGRLYRLAREIMITEDNNQFLETMTDEMIAVDSYLPYEGIDFSCEKKSWNIAEIDAHIRKLLSINLPFLMYEGTKVTPLNIEYYDKIYKINIGAEDYSDLKVNTIYDPEWETNLDVKPRRGKEVRPINTAMSYLSFGCMKMYHHKYSLNYPVLFQIIDTNNPDQQFFFVTPVIVKNNVPDRAGQVVSWPPQVDKRDSTEYCARQIMVTDFVVDEISGKIIAYPNEVHEKDFYPLRVFVLDDYYQGARPALTNVTIGYQCVSYLCDSVGITEYPVTGTGLWTGEQPQLKADFPPCTGGIVTAKKDGYLDAYVQQTVSEETSNSQVTISMIEKMPKDFTVQVEIENNGVKSTRGLLSSETALVTIENIENEVSQYLYVTSESKSSFEDFFLLFGNHEYNIDIKLVSDNALVGGAELIWTPTISDLESKQQVVFYAERKISATPPTTPEEYEELWNFAVENSREPIMI